LFYWDFLKKMLHQNKHIQTYIELLKAYNETTNIYSKKAYDKLPFHIDDSLYLASLLKEGKHIIDIGSGSGLPSIILAITLPNVRISAIESKSRKTRFLHHVKESLQLNNLHIYTKNVFEVIHTLPKPSFVTAKAFGSYDKIKTICEKISSPQCPIIVPISENQIPSLSEKNVSIIKSPDNRFFYWKDHLN